VGDWFKRCKFSGTAALCAMNLFTGELNRPELRFLDLLFPWMVVAIMEHAGLSNYVWHSPLFFLALVVLFSGVIGMLLLP
jgi:Protein of unknown function (DUF1656)